MKTPGLLFVLTGGLVLILGAAAFFVPVHYSQDCADFLILQGQAPQIGVTQSFSSEESDDAYMLTYCWQDYDQRKFESTFSILKEALKDAEEEFGYNPDELDLYVSRALEPLRSEMILHLKNTVENLIRKSKYSDHFNIEEKKTEGFNFKLSTPPSGYDEVKAEFERINTVITREQAKYFRKIEKAIPGYKKQFLEARGLRYFGSKIGINYSYLAGNNRSRVEGVFHSLQRIGEGLNLPQFLSLLLSFIQEIRYGIPPFSENGKYILGFWVPPKVLVNNFGDCDSKGVTFASLWLSYKRFPLLLFKIPNHMFIGLAIPLYAESEIIINGLRYTLFEVTGPDKFPMGIISSYSRMYLEGGNYTYELIK